MIQEYLVVNNDDIEKIKEYKPDGVTVNIFSLGEDKGIIISISHKNDNEDVARRLSEIDEQIRSNYHVTILQNGAAAYFNGRLYPLISSFECKLRKLLYLAAAVNPSKKSSQNISDLESKDFGKIFEILFVDDAFYTTVRTTVPKKDRDIFVKESILSYIDSINEKPLWNDLLGEDTVPTLKRRLIDTRDYRNDVMHSHYISFDRYKDIRDLYKTLIDELDKAIYKFSGGTETDKSFEFNETLHQALSASDSRRAMESLASAAEINNPSSSLDLLLKAFEIVDQQNARNALDTRNALVENMREIMNGIRQLGGLIVNLPDQSDQQLTEE